VSADGEDNESAVRHEVIAKNAPSAEKRPQADAPKVNENDLRIANTILHDRDWRRCSDGGAEEPKRSSIANQPQQRES
jgi:hypothetical protein